MAMLRALALLALLRAAPAGASGPGAPDPPNVSRFANVSAFTVSGPTRGGSLRGAKAPSTLKVIAHGDAECSRGARCRPDGGAVRGGGGGALAHRPAVPLL
jgi:hypothetical protein